MRELCEEAIDAATAAGAGYADARAALLGAGSFLLPCGFTQAVQVYALSTGDPIRGALIMGGFALGTMPGLLAIGGLVASTRGVVGEKVLRFAGVVVLAFAALNLGGAVATLAPGLTWPGAGPHTPTAISSNVTLEDGIQVLHTDQGLDGYSPADATVRVGRPVRWDVNSVSMGCASLLDAKQLGLPRTMLRLGHNTLEFTPTEPGTYHYACAMGMFRGTVTVIR